MAQEKIKFGWSTSSLEVVRQPDSGLAYGFETTYTEDSKRLQSGTLNMKPMFTVESYGFKASSVTKAELAQLLKYVGRGKKFYMRYYCPFTSGDSSSTPIGWRTSQFFVGKGSLSIGYLNESNEKFDEVSFNIIGVNPV